MQKLPIILSALLIVITDPYKDIKYDEINIYEYETECLDNCIGYTESDGWNDEDESVELTDEEKILMQQLTDIAKRLVSDNSVLH